MRIRSIQIDGYGRFADKSLEFAPGLQIIAGPGGHGKSTIRDFIADMLFGQRCNDVQRAYDQANASRIPVNGCESYGGSITFELDDARLLEVVRDFDRNHAFVQIFDRDRDIDITDTFNRSRNREPEFARQHLRMVKEAFLNTATISRIPQNGTGDSNPLDQIRQAMLVLVDSGGGAATVEIALDNLANRIARIGRPDTAGKPLPMAWQQLGDLKAQRVSAREQQESLRTLAADRKTILDANIDLQRQKREAETALSAHAHCDESDRLEQAEAVQAQLDALADQLAALENTAAFPDDSDTEVQSARAELEASVRQLKATRAQYDALRDQNSTAPEEGPAGGEFPPALERKLDEAMAASNRVSERMLEARTLARAATDRIEDVQRQLAELPDFSRLAADPVEWLSQLASSFNVALRARNEERALRDAARKEVEALEDISAPYDGLFANCADFSELAREYETQIRRHDGQVKRQASELHSLQVSFDETRGESRAFLPLGLFCLAVTTVLGGIHITNDDMETIYFAVLTLFVGVIFLFMHLDHKGRLKRLDGSIQAARNELAELEDRERDKSLDIIADMLGEAELDTVRELEARYENYKANQAELKIRRENLAAQNEKAVEAEERIPQLVERFKDTFAKAGETIETEHDIQDAAGRAIARYQDYREAKRRATSNRSVLERHEAELKRLEGLATQHKRELAALEREAREFVRAAGLLDHDDAPIREVIAAYRQHVDNGRERQGRQDVFAENLRDMERRIALETAELEQCQNRLDALLDRHGVASVELWDAMAADAREYRHLEKQRDGLQAHLAGILGEETLPALRERLAPHGDSPRRPRESRTALERTIADIEAALDQNIRAEHDVQCQITAGAVHAPSLAEIEEETALLEANIHAMEAEIEATSYAMACMESIARDRHAELAPRLAREASQHLAAITGGSCTELLVGLDFTIQIRTPNATSGEQHETAPDNGTIDQVYLALRLAFSQHLRAHGEAIPLLLDDPFTNINEEWLKSTMAHIAEVAGHNQILLFTRREEVVAAAEAQKAAIIQL